MARDSNSSKPSSSYSESGRSQDVGRRERECGQETYDDVRHLAERLVLSVRGLLVLSLGEVNRVERVRDIALLRNECYTTRASGPGESVEFKRGPSGAHDESADGSEGAAIQSTPISSYICARIDTLSISA